MDAPKSGNSLAVKLSLLVGSIALVLGGTAAWLQLRHKPKTMRVEDFPKEVMEGGATTLWYQNIYRDSSDKVMGRELIPNSGNGVVVVNKYGYVGHVEDPYPPERSPNTFRIIGLGDSVTMYYAEEKKNYLSVLEQSYAKAAPAPKVEVLDFGIAGYDTASEVRRLEVEGLKYKPDLVVVGFVLNDAISFPFVINSVFNVPVADEEEGESSKMLDFVTKGLSATQAKKQEFFDKIFASELWRNDVQALNHLDQLAQANGFKVVVTVFPMFISFNPYQLQPLHDAVKVQAQRHNFGFLDLAPVYGAKGDVRQFAFSGASGTDTIHPNLKGHELAGQALYDYLVSSGFGPPKAVSTLK